MRWLLLIALFATRAAAQPAPNAVLAAGIDEHPGARLPLATPLVDSRSGDTTLQALFDGVHPVLLVLAYARCTMLCSVVLRATGEAVRELERAGRIPGRDYRLAVISLDPRETVDEARRRQTTLVARIGGYPWP